ncbi:hypothetical protein H6501_02000 [Candidatus Woesearchaeota archaeon]|nr:hypothetical protein [Candidatus Woesearchaeota archaeon]USN44870.1 MAG: hypothetical protein H6500_03445 [Candidatus Woesearchaeota archaeon]
MDKVSSSKKALSPVVASVLLIVVAVLASLGFQTWYQSFSSSTLSHVDTQSSSGSFSVEGLSGGTLFVKGSAKIQSVSINGNDCFVSGLTNSSLNVLPMSDCANEGKNEIVVVANDRIYTKIEYLDSYVYSNPCPDGYIIVPGNAGLGTRNFCVMKYEAKNVSYVAISQAASTPWANITWNAAKTECENLGSGYHLMTEEERLTIAHNVEFVASNWNSSVVGTGFLYSGHNDGSPYTALVADTDDGNGYYGTTDSAGSNQRRTLNLSNDEIIWDFAGNVWEWVDAWAYANESLGSPYRYHGGDQGWMSYNSDDGTGKNASLVPTSKLPSNGWNANQGMGRYHDGSDILGASNNVNEAPDFCTGYCSPKAVFLAGGFWGTQVRAGVFALLLGDGPSGSFTTAGFRCSYS